MSNLDDGSVSEIGLPAAGDTTAAAIKKLRARINERVADHVTDADPTDLTSLATSIDAIRDVLVTAGLMDPS